MNKHIRGLSAALLTAVLVLAVPAAAASRQTRTQKILKSAKRALDAFVPWLNSRLTPPGGSPAPDQEETTTTDGPAPKPTQ